MAALLDEGDNYELFQFVSDICEFVLMMINWLCIVGTMCISYFVIYNSEEISNNITSIVNPTLVINYVLIEKTSKCVLFINVFILFNC